MKIFDPKLTGSIEFQNPVQGNIEITGDLVVPGSITAREFKTEFVSASIIYKSGSTQFGNSTDDTHQFTGSTYLGRTYINDQVDISNNYSINFGSSRIHSSDTSYFIGGNVGINKTDPDALLDIQYKDGTHNLYRATDSTGQYRWRVDQFFNQYHTNAAGADIIAITNSGSYFNVGNVGIGNTSPLYPLHISSTSAYQAAIKSTGAQYLLIGSENASTAGIILDGDSNGDGAGGDYSYIVHENSGVLKIVQDSPAGTNQISFGTGGTENKVIIDTNGNVGIGTTSPTQKLHIHGAGSYNFNPATEKINSVATIVSDEMTDSDYHSILQLVSVRQSLSTGNAANGFLGFSTVDDSNGQGIRDAGRIAIVNESGNARNSATALSFWTNPGGVTSTVSPTEKMRIDSSGNVTLSTGDLFINSGTSYNDKGYIYLSNQRTAIISDIVNLTANGDTSLDFQTRSGGSTASSMFIDEFRNINIGTTGPTNPARVNIETSGATQVGTGIRLINPYGFASAGTGVQIIFAQDRSESEDFSMAVIRSSQSTGGTSDNGDLKFFTRGSGTLGERMRILSSGGITFNGDSTSANALDDYEEGNYTPVVYTTSGTPTYQYQEGYYTKIGRQVFGGGIIGITNSSSLGGTIEVSLPFTSRSSTYGTAGVTFADGSGFTWPVTTTNNSYSVYNMQAVIYQNQPKFSCVTITPSAGYIGYGSSGVSNTWYFRFSFNYAV